MFLFFFFIFFYFVLYLTTHTVFIFWLIVITNIIVACLMTILSVNPVNSIFFLIALFLNVSIAFFSLNLVYLALILIIVYVGALAIFFLFTLMLLNINMLFAFRPQKNVYKKIVDIIILLFIVVHLFFFLNEFFIIAQEKNQEIDYLGNLFNLNTLFFSTIELYAATLYTIYSSIFILLGFFLFIVMIGVILLIQQNSYLLQSTVTSMQFFRNFKTTIFHSNI